MKEEKINNVLSFLNEFSKTQYKLGKRKTRELFPEFSLISKECKIKQELIKEIIDELEKRGEIVRFTSQRYLKWVWQKINEKHSYPEKKEEKKSIIKEKMNLSLLIIKVMITIPAFIAAIMSIHYTRIWFLNYLHPFLASISSIAIVLSNIGAFESIFLFGKKKQHIQIVLAIIVFIITCSFSMGTTLAGQLNNEIKSKKLLINRNSNNENNRLLTITYKEKIESLNQDLNRLRKEYDHNIKQKEKFSDVTKDSKYWTFNHLAYKRKEEINKLKKEIKEYEIKLEDLLNKKVILKEIKEINIFIWLQDLFKIKSDITKFILYMIPAIFYDIISPFFFAIIFFYKMEAQNV